MERARSEWLRAAGITQQALFESGVQLVVHRLECRYARPARLDDALEVSADVLSAGRARLRFGQRVTRGGEPLCEASVDIACIDARRFRPRPWPPALAELLASFSDQPQALRGCP